MTWLAIGSAFSLGLFTAISPCPLATNIAAVSFLARRIHSRRLAVGGAVAYAVGRAVVYVVIGLTITWGLASAPSLSENLQRLVAPFIGPILIVVGMILLGWIKLPLDFGFRNAAMAERLATYGLLGEFVLGALFALTFCPVSAALFFGALLPTAVTQSHPWSFFAVYGVATALPVGVLAIFIALGAGAARIIMERIQGSGEVIKTVSAAVIILVGVWLTLSLLMD